MFNSLIGILREKLEQKIYLDTGTIEWDISMPETSISLLPPLGEQARIYTWLDFRQDNLRLFGFFSTQERSVFLDIMKVEGIGPRAAIRILSSIRSADLVSALDSEDLARLEKIPGIGKKTAQKMMLTLKGKLQLDTQPTINRTNDTAEPWQAVRTALVNMGYDKRLCNDTLLQLSSEFAHNTEFMALSQSGKEDFLFKKAIVALI